MKQFFSVRTALSGFVLILLFVAVPSANHSWGGYHWARASVLSLDVGNNLSSTWDPYLGFAIADWNASSKLDLLEKPGGTTARKCRPTAGRIEVCNAAYGNNGWLGIAQIWLSGGHISQAITKVNDTYYNTATYNTPAWRRMVMCQEIGHDFGLDHQDETNTNTNLGSCMDYTNNPSGPPSNVSPNDHDYVQLESIYGHSDGAAAAGFDADAPDHPSQWGRLLHQNADRRIQVFELEMGNGRKMVTRVLWADEERDAPGNSDKNKK